MIRRVAPAVGLFLLAPLVAEFLLGNLPVTMLYSLVGLAPLYGGGALLIREVVRRTGRGWPTILLLAAAYGVVEEGIATQSLFDAGYAGQHLLAAGYVPALGIAVPWTMFVLTLHTAWSIATPIALVEVLAGDRGREPWLKLPGLVVAAVLFVAGVAFTRVFSAATDGYHAPAWLLVEAGVAVVVLVVVAFVVGRRPAAPLPGHAPAPWVCGLVALAAGAVFFLAEALPGSWGVAAWIVLFTAVATFVSRWARRDGWSPAHILGLAGGALLTYAWHAFVETPVVPVTPGVDRAGDIVFGLAAVLLLGVAVRVTAHRRHVRAAEPEAVELRP